MKKKLFLLIGILFLFPVIVQASEQEFHRRTSNYGDLQCENANRTVGLDTHYENGIYYLDDIQESFSTGSAWISSAEKVYMCETVNQTECEVIKVLYKDKTCHNSQGYPGHTVYKLQDGLKDISVFYVGTDYKYEKGMYILTEYEEHDIDELIHSSSLSTKYEGKYYCMNYAKECSHLYKISSAGVNWASQSYSNFVDLEEYYLVSHQFMKKDNQYYLIDPQKVYLTEDGGVTGYTCRSHSDHCDSIYKIYTDEIYDGRDGRMVTLDVLTIENDSIEKTIKLDEAFNVSTFFREEEISKVFSTKPEIAEIVNGELVLYRVGTTDLIYEDDTTYKVIHLTVTQEALSGNPKTRNTMIFTIILGLTLIISMIAFQRKYSL